MKHRIDTSTRAGGDPARGFRRALARGACVALLLASIGCGGAYGKAISRGDDFAAANQWDEAAAAYQEAMKLDPEGTEARIKLTQARHRQAEERLERARALEGRGELKGALALIQEAAELEPESASVQTALTRLSHAALERADELSRDGKLREGFELTSLVLAGSPDHPRAKKLDRKLREQLAQQAFDQAKSYADKDKPGNALAELAACLQYRPDYPDAKILFGQVKLQLEDKLRFYVVLDRFEGKGTSAALSKSIDPSLLQQAFDERLLLRVVTKPPAKDVARRGVTMTGELAEYDFARDKKANRRSCDYVCGTTYKPNPRIAELRNQLASHDQQLAGVDDRIARAEQDLLRAEAELSRYQQDEAKKQADVDEARNRLDQCRQKAASSSSSSSSNPCSSEESNLRSKQSYLDSERSRVNSARQRVQTERSDVEREKSGRDHHRRSREQTNQELLRTPEQVAVDKFCPFDYVVERHDVRAHLTVKLTIRELEADKTIVADQPFRYDEAAADETHPAHPGRCREVAAGDPLSLPDEAALRKQLVTKVMGDLRQKALASYDAYRRGFLAAARRDESAGLTDEATESYMRYLLTGAHQAKNDAQIAEFFQRNKGLSSLEALWKL